MRLTERLQDGALPQSAELFTVRAQWQECSESGTELSEVGASWRRNGNGVMGRHLEPGFAAKA